MASGLNKQSLREKANSSHLQMKIFKCLRDVKVEDSDHFWHFVVRDLVAAQKGNDRLPSARKTSLSNFQIYFYFSASFVPKNLNFLCLLHSSEMFFSLEMRRTKEKNQRLQLCHVELAHVAVVVASGEAFGCRPDGQEFKSLQEMGS